ncbi:MAG TPA: phosphoribosylglycinamide formyltransferase [Chthoniobacterales bacterium]
MTTETPLLPLRLGVLGSGKGSNFRAIAAQIAEGKLNAEIVVVLSDVPEAGILDYARKMGVPAIAFDPGKFRTKLEPEIEGQVAALLEEHRVELVVLAGFMRIVKYDLLTKFSRRIINIHPSLLPKHRGLHAWEQALLAGDTVAGCTVHYVDRGIDTGEIIAQTEVPVQTGDSPETLHARIQAAEHELYPRVIAGFCENRPPAAE